MKNHNIDDLLQVVDSNLVTNYENSQLQGISLKTLNEERASVGIDPVLSLVRVFTYFLWALLISVVWLIGCTSYEKPLYISLSLPIVLIGPIFIYVMVPVRRCMRVIEKCEPSLEEFRNVVTALNPLGVTIREYNETAVRHVLVGLAVRILEAESKFDVVRMQKERRTFDILHCVTWLERCQSQLEQTLGQARKFGLEFKKADLFVDAKTHMDRTNRLLEA